MADAEGVSDEKRVAAAVSHYGGHSVVGEKLNVTARAVNKWTNKNIVPPEQVPEFIEKVGDEFHPSELNPRCYPKWMFEKFSHANAS